MGMFRIKLDQCDAEDRSGRSNEKNNGGEDGGPKFSSNFHLSSDEQINFFFFLFKMLTSILWAVSSFLVKGG